MNTDLHGFSGEIEKTKADVDGTVYMLCFVQEQEDNEDVELLIGVLETEEQAKAAIDRREDKPSFVYFPEGFQIHPTKLGEEGWIDGFIRD